MRRPLKFLCARFCSSWTYCWFRLSFSVARGLFWNELVLLEVGLHRVRAWCVLLCICFAPEWVGHLCGSTWQLAFSTLAALCLPTVRRSFVRKSCSGISSGIRSRCALRAFPVRGYCLGQAAVTRAVCPRKVASAGTSSFSSSSDDSPSFSVQGSSTSSSFPSCHLVHYCPRI